MNLIGLVFVINVEFIIVFGCVVNCFILLMLFSVVVCVVFGEFVDEGLFIG